MYQKITIIGNLGRDPEMRYLANGTAMTNFSVATSRKWTDRSSGQQREETVWFRVSAFERMAEVANEYLAKGKQVFVEGRLNPDPETGGPRVFTRQDGTVGASYEIRALEIKFLGGRADSGFSEPGGERSAPAQEEDEIPF